MGCDAKPACPHCGGLESCVIDSRGSYRRRQCLNPDCDERFSTEERTRKPWEQRTPHHRVSHALRQPSLIS
jgi:hypothetical protein